MPTTRSSEPSQPRPTGEPWNSAPKAKTPPSAATSQYPVPSGSAAMATIGWFRRMSPVEP